jgi:hypothetical protein
LTPYPRIDTTETWQRRLSLRSPSTHTVQKSIRRPSRAPIRLRSNCIKKLILLKKWSPPREHPLKKLPLFREINFLIQMEQTPPIMVEVRLNLHPLCFVPNVGSVPREPDLLHPPQRHGDHLSCECFHSNGPPRPFTFLGRLLKALENEFTQEQDSEMIVVVCKSFFFSIILNQ